MQAHLGITVRLNNLCLCVYTIHHTFIIHNVTSIIHNHTLPSVCQQFREGLLSLETLTQSALENASDLTDARPQSSQPRSIQGGPNCPRSTDPSEGFKAPAWLPVFVPAKPRTCHMISVSMVN